MVGHAHPGPVLIRLGCRSDVTSNRVFLSTQRTEHTARTAFCALSCVRVAVFTLCVRLFGVDDARRRAVVFLVAHGVRAGALVVENNAADALVINMQFDNEMFVAVGVAGAVAVFIGNVDE